MSKRRSAVYGKKGSGTHQPEHQKEARPAGEVKPVISRTKHGKMIHLDEFHDTDETPSTGVKIMAEIAAMRRGCFWFAGIMAILCLLVFFTAVKAHGQTHFEFNAKSVYLIIDKQSPTAFGPLPVSSWADTLLIGPPTLPLIRLYNVNWSRMDSGNMYHLAPGVQIRYEAGPGGKTVYVRTGRAVIECYELTTEKL